MARDTEFYERRIAEERAAAASAVNGIVRERHNQLADLYAEQLKPMSDRGRFRPRATLEVAIDNASQRV